MKKITKLLAAIWVVSLCASAEENTAVSVFAFGGVGFAGITNEGEYRFGESARSEDPKEAFHQWYAAGKNEEKAYCMVGFYYFDRKRYEELKNQYLGKGIVIKNVDGCLAGTISLETLISQIEMERFKPYLDNPVVRPTKPTKEIQSEVSTPLAPALLTP